VTGAIHHIDPLLAALRQRTNGVRSDVSSDVSPDVLKMMHLGNDADMTRLMTSTKHIQIVQPRRAGNSFARLQISRKNFLHQRKSTCACCEKKIMTSREFGAEFVDALHRSSIAKWACYRRLKTNLHILIFTVWLVER
jgi:hypothetical protein